MHCPYLQLPLDDPIFGDSRPLPARSATGRPAARLQRLQRGKGPLRLGRLTRRLGRLGSPRPTGDPTHNIAFLDSSTTSTVAATTASLYTSRNATSSRGQHGRR
jgi:hypothetical protein